MPRCMLRVPSKIRFAVCPDGPASIAMAWSNWPFKSEEAFWTWAMDSLAEVDDQDEDLLLRDVAGLGLLVAAADDADCPKSGYCRNVVEHHAVWLIAFGSTEDHNAVRATAARAADGVLPKTRRLAAYLQRLLEYREHPQGPVNRALAEQMAADLLSSPSALERLPHRSPSDWLQVQITSNGRHWHGAQPWVTGTHLYINRRTGAWRLQLSRALPVDELAKI